MLRSNPGSADCARHRNARTTHRLRRCWGANASQDVGYAHGWDIPVEFPEEKEVEKNVVVNEFLLVIYYISFGLIWELTCTFL